MVMRIGGGRRKTRQKYTKSAGLRGKISLRSYLQRFEKGDKVALIAETAVHEGMYFRRFHGKSGTVTRARGRCYEVSVVDQGKEKRVIVHPVHLRRL